MLRSMRPGPLAKRDPVVLPAGPLELASDECLAERVRGGSVRAFEVLFERHHRGVLAFCEHMLGCRDEAEDAVQQAFIAAYRDLARGSEPRALRPWLYGIARRRCLAALAARRPDRDVVAAEPACESLTSGIVVRENLREALADLAALPDDQRAALVLAELGGLPHERIADVLGCRREKVKALVFQARTSLVAAREARDTPCSIVRDQLATPGDAALRRGVLRRHLRDCVSCRRFRDELRRGRPALGLLLPVAPAAWLRRVLLGGVPGSAGGAAGGGALAGISLGGVSIGGAALAATALVAAAIPAGIVGVAAVAETDARPAVPSDGRWHGAAGSPLLAPAPIAATEPVAQRDTGGPAPKRSLLGPSHPTGDPAPARAPVAGGVPQVDAPEASAGETPGRPAEPPGHPKPATDDRSGRPAEPPGQAKKDENADADGGGRPAEPPGQAKKDTTAGADRGGRPAEPPGKAKKDDSASTERPGASAEPPGRSGDDGATGRPDPPGNGHPTPPGLVDHPHAAPPGQQHRPAQRPQQPATVDAPEPADGVDTVAPSPPTPPTRSNPSAARCGC